MSEESRLISDLKRLLVSEVVATQENLCEELLRLGHQVNQSKISRLLRKVNAVKVKDDQGEMVYSLPHDVMPPSVQATLNELVLDVVANEVVIVIRTSPGSASLIARMLDHKKCQIIGTIAGDDTVMVMPQSIKNIKETQHNIKNILKV